MGDSSSAADIQHSLQELNQLRHDSNRSTCPNQITLNLNSISRVFHTAAEGLSGEEGEEGKRKFFNNIKGQIDTVNEALNNVEKDLNQSINPPTTLLLRYFSNISEFR